MFAWGEDSLRGFRLRDGGCPGNGPPEGDAVAPLAPLAPLALGYHVRDLSGGRCALAFVKTNGNAFIMRTSVDRDGVRVRGKQKFVSCREKVQAVSCGHDAVLLLTEAGTVLCVDTTRPPLTSRPLDALRGVAVSQVACGSHHSVVLAQDGQVYTWGQDSRGQLGVGKKKSSGDSAQHVRSLAATPLVRVAAGGDHSLALSVSGAVFCWGRNDHGQLGLGDTKDRHSPTALHSLDMKKTVHVSCGEDHTAALTKDGAVFTFGSGQFGQLGHNSFRDELRPRLVAELLGAKVIEVACGLRHTLVLTDSRKVYSFGCGEQGQLGHGGSGVRIRNIFAGGNCSFATCASDEDVNEERETDSGSSGTRYCLDDMIDRWASKCDSKTWKKIKVQIHRTFSSAACMNQSFLERSADKHFQTSQKYPGLNLTLARAAFQKLVNKDAVLAEVEAAVMNLLPSLDRSPVGVEALRIILLLNELLDVVQNNKLAVAVAAAVLRLSPESLQVIGDWWTSLSVSTMLRYVEVWKKALTIIFSFGPVPRNSGVRNLLHVLHCMYDANSRTAASRRIPDRKFYLVIDMNFLVEDLQHWLLQTKNKSSSACPLVLCRYPIVMDVQTKKLVFNMLVGHTMSKTLGIWWDYFVQRGPEPPLPRTLLFELDLRRAAILEDTFEQLHYTDESDFRRPLVVYFDGNFVHDNVNKKDLFHDVFHEMLSAESEMFIFNDAKTLAWFPSRATQDHRRYFLFGVLCGLALYNQCIIYLPFPMALFKKLLDIKPSLEDMKEFCPCTGGSLQSILQEYSDQDFEDLDLDYLITWDRTDVDLDPDNPGKRVTSQNKKEFVDAYVSHAFNVSVETVFMEFTRGFFRVCERDVVKLFQPKELQDVLVGKDFQAWDRLKQSTCYELPYLPEHPNIQMFWEVFNDLTEDQKKTFLWFVTGFDRVPIHGVENIKMTIRVKYPDNWDIADDEYYPQTHTCFSILELPLYSTREILQTKLTEALSNRRRLHR